MKAALLLIPALAVLALVFLREPAEPAQGDSLSPTAAMPARQAAAPGGQPGELIEASQAQGQRGVARIASGEESGMEAVAGGSAGPFGRVVTASGAPLADAEVSLARSSNSPTVVLGRQSKELGSAVSDAKGRFRIAEATGSGAHEVIVRLAGYQVLHHPAAGQDLGDLVLDPGMIIGGTVLDFHGNPVADALVVREIPGERSLLSAALLSSRLDSRAASLMAGDHGALTDDKGRFELAHESPGEVKLTVAHPEHPRLVHVAEGRVGDTLDETLLMPESASIVGRIEGIQGDADGTVQVFAEPRQTGGQKSGSGFLSLGPSAERSADVEQDGTFELTGLQAGGTYSVWASQSKSSRFDTETCSEKVIAVAGGSNVQLAYQNGASLSFTVVDAKTGEPIEDVDVQHSWASGGSASIIRMPSQQRSKYPAGEVQVSPLRPSDPPAILTVKLTAPGYRSEELSPSIPAEGEVNLGLVQLTPTASLVVRVESADGQALEGAKVQLAGPGASPMTIGGGSRPSGVAVRSVSVSVSTDSQGSNIPDLDQILGRGKPADEAVTDAEGLCRIALPDKPTGTLTVTAKGYATSVEKDIPLPRTGSPEHVVVLSKGGTIILSVLTSDGNPAPSVRVEQNGQRGKHTSDSDGRIQLDNVAPGQHHFRLAEKETGGISMVFASTTDEEDFSDWTTVNVVEGGTAAATLTLMPSGSLTGTVLSQGEPVRRARLKLMRVDESLSERERTMRDVMDSVGSLSFGGTGDASEKTDTKGRYTLNGVEVGLYNLRVTHPDWAMPQEYEVFIQEGSNKMDLDLSVCILQGRILDTQGEPVAGAEVSVGEEKEGSSSFRIGFSVNGALGMPTPGAVKTDKDGRYELKGVDPDRALVVRANADGFAPAELTTPEMYTNESRSGVDLVLKRGARLTVVLDDAADPSTMVMATPAKGEPLMQRAGGGRAIFEGMNPGEWTVSLAAIGGDAVANAREKVTLGDEEERSIVLDGEPD